MTIFDRFFLIYIDMYILYISNIYLWKWNVKNIWKMEDNISNQGFEAIPNRQDEGTV